MKKLGRSKVNEMMDEDKYWSIIENSHTKMFWDYRKFRNQLTGLSLQDLGKFFLRSAELTQRLYLSQIGAAAEIMNRDYAYRYGYADNYLVFRHWIITKGKLTYYEVLKNADFLVNHVVPDPDYIYKFENLNTEPRMMFHHYTGHDLFDFIETQYVPQDVKRLYSDVFLNEHLHVDFKKRECPQLFQLFQELEKEKLIVDYDIKGILSQLTNSEGIEVIPFGLTEKD